MDAIWETRVLRNPWPHTIPDHELLEIVHTVARVRAEHVVKHFEERRYERDSLAIAILNPSAANSTPTRETLLAIIMIGNKGAAFVPNAIANAFYHRDHSQPAGFGRYVDLVQSADGDFTGGYSTHVDGTIAAASGQSMIQDAMEAGHAAVSFNYWVREERARWLEKNPDNRWFCDTDQPGELYAELAKRAINEGR